MNNFDDIVAILRVIAIFQQYKLDSVQAMVRLLEYKVNLFAYHSVSKNESFEPILFCRLLQSNNCIKHFNVNYLDPQNIQIDLETIFPSQSKEVLRIVINSLATESEMFDRRMALKETIKECLQST